MSIQEIPPPPPPHPISNTRLYEPSGVTAASKTKLHVTLPFSFAHLHRRSSEGCGPEIKGFFGSGADTTSTIRRKTTCLYPAKLSFHTCLPTN